MRMCTNTPAVHNRPKFFMLPSFRCITYAKNFGLGTSLSVSTLNAHSPNLDQIQINPNPLPEVVSIWIDLDRAVVREDQKGRGMHARVLNTNSEHASPGYTLCFTYLLNLRSNMMAG